MKLFKKILIIISILFSFSFIGDKKDVYINWQPSNSGYWTYGMGYNVYNDFDYCVTRNVYDKSGYYYYDFWFYSQSYYWDGANAKYTSTNVRNISIFINEGYGLKLINYDYTPLGITFFGQFCAKNLTIKSRSFNPMLVIKWNNMSAL